MREAKTLLALGVWVAVLPYLGFPHSLKNILSSMTGLGLIYLSYATRGKPKAGETKEKISDNFSENGDFDENEIKPRE